MLPVIIPAGDGWVVVQRPKDGPVQVSTHTPAGFDLPVPLTPEAIQLLMAALMAAERERRPKRKAVRRRAT
jgi:hypothetical protein